MEKTKAKVALAGAGYWGKNLARNFHALGALGAICDQDRKTQDLFRQQYPQAPVYATLDEALADPSINAVALATPAVSHYSMVEQSLLAGRHVFVEKPLCLDAADGEKLVALARRTGLTLMVGHLLQYHPAARKLKEMIAGGELGRLQYIYSNRLNLGKIRTEENILWSFAPHDISLILGYAGQPPSSVAAFGSHFLNKDIADVTVSSLSFPSGVSAHIFVSWLHPFKEQKLVVVGDRGMAVFDDTSAENKLLFYPHSVKWKDGIPTPDKKDAVRVDHGKEEPLREECAHFIRCVETGEKPVTDGAEGLAVLRVLQACQKSMESGGAIVAPGREPAPSKPAAKSPLHYFAHETAVVDEGASIGEGTKIWHFSHIMKNTSVGKNCNIGQNVVAGPDVTIGDGCKIQNNVSVYKGVTLEKNVFCGPSMVFTNVYNPRSHIRRMDELRPTLVKEGATIGANATIMCGITLGRYCLVGAGAMVLKDVPDYAMVVGNPAVEKGWVCECCARLKGSGKKFACPACGKKYKMTMAGLEPVE